MDLAAALAFSRYAPRRWPPHPGAADELAATLDAPFAWAAARSRARRRASRPAMPRALGAALRALRRRVLRAHARARPDRPRRPGRSLRAMTTLAEVALAPPSRCTTRALAADARRAASATTGAPQALVVIGMGKLGGGELNVSSDIDLVFVYPEEGETDGAAPLANREFFDRLGRRVIARAERRHRRRLRVPRRHAAAALRRQRAADGAVRGARAVPDHAGPRLGALRVAQGARADRRRGTTSSTALVTPFVFRKYLDYDAYDGLRDIHRQIREQGKRRDYAPNIKLGAGRHPRDRVHRAGAADRARRARAGAARARHAAGARRARARAACCRSGAVAALRDAYVFLRNVEHRLQYRDDQQTQTLPADAARARGARATRWAAPAPPRSTRRSPRHRATVARAVQRGVRRRRAARRRRRRRRRGDDGAAPRSRRSGATTSARIGAATLAAAGFADPDGAARDARARARERALPAAAGAVAAALRRAGAAAARGRGRDRQSGAPTRRRCSCACSTLLEAVSRRSAYLALLIEHPPLLPRLAQLMGASAWAADYLTRHPILLDELLDARVLLAEPDWDAWRAELARAARASTRGDAERQMDALRHFQHAQTFRLLAQDLAGQLTVERLADHLSALADIDPRRRRSPTCWAQMRGARRRRRRASRSSATASSAARSWATRPTSTSCSSTTDADEPTRAGALRAARAAAHHLAHQHDRRRPALRDRPAAAARRRRRPARVVASPAFRRYQREQAWTWEHQALTRARFVAGDAAIGAAFEAERDAILRLPRDPREARAPTSSRCARKMRAGHPNPTPLFDLKHDPGGMVDIEFAVQYLVLAHAHDHPALTRNAGNIALLRHRRRARARARADWRARRPTPTATTAGCSTRSA